MPTDLIINNSSECPNKTQCGSCEFSELPYEAQTSKKLNEMNLLLSENRLVCTKILPSPQIAHYRNKMDYIIDFKRQVGLREKGKWWKVIDGHTCFLADTHIEDAFFKTRDWVKSTPLTCWDRKTYGGFLRYAVVRTTLTGETLLTIVTSLPKDADEESLARTEFSKLITATGVASFVWSVNETKSDISYGSKLTTLHGLGYITEIINGLKYKISPNSFFQTNSHSAPILQSHVVDAVVAPGAKNVLDLYCGSGFFALALAAKGLQAEGVEVVEDAIEDAKFNADLNKLSVGFKASPAEDLTWKHGKYDAVVVDPTRAGLHPKVLTALLTMKPKTLVYVSCNYKQFNAELPKLQEFYKVTSCVAIDQFPQTAHVELISVLKGH